MKQEHWIWAGVAVLGIVLWKASSDKKKAAAAAAAAANSGENMSNYLEEPKWVDCRGGNCEDVCKRFGGTFDGNRGNYGACCCTSANLGTTPEYGRPQVARNTMFRPTKQVVRTVRR